MAKKTITFASTIVIYVQIWGEQRFLNNNLTVCLSYGVMVALQFLVLSVVVRIRLGQRKAASEEISVAAFLCINPKKTLPDDYKTSFL